MTSFSWAAVVLCLLSSLPAYATDQPIPVRVVVVTMFEQGEDTGDDPGEFQYWVERFPLPEKIAFPAGSRNLRYNADKQVLAMVTGIGTARAASSIMALGMDPRFDLSKSYWLVAGIAGANPHAITLGAAAWAEWVIDGDLAHEIDAREIPSDWPTGYFPLFTTKPYYEPRPTENLGNAYRLNTRLRDWAFALTRDVALPDSKPLQELRARFEGFPEAQKPPAVVKGDTLSAMTFWHGTYLNDWAEDWVKYWTNGEGRFATSAMEDTGTLQALTFLDQAGRADIDRVMVLRTTSNFAMQHPGQSAAESMLQEGKGYSAFLPSLDAAYVVGSKVVNELSENWAKYEAGVP
jgi:purine nucleoside permease